MADIRTLFAPFSRDPTGNGSAPHRLDEGNGSAPHRLDEGIPRTVTPSVQPPLTRCRTISSSSSSAMKDSLDLSHNDEFNLSFIFSSAPASICCHIITITDDEDVQNTPDTDVVEGVEDELDTILVLRQPKDVLVLLLSFPWPSMASDLPIKIRDSDTTSPLLCENRIRWIRANRC
ncbi:hypothetical protein BC830DRAFT_836678 [Chytriomyces sp. MP71]|nr:hypothetical protein BC830DRAFT_836678 [Chytriomyces sp. MP71]